MSSNALFDLRARILANTLTTSQQDALAQALAIIAPAFPQPDEQANGIAGALEQPLVREWYAALYNINAGGGDMPPPGFVTDVTGIPPIDSSGGTTPAISITPATGVAAGSMSAADKAKLDGLAPGVTSVGAAAPITSTGGTTPAIGITPATEADAGSMSAADKAKLDALAPPLAAAMAVNASPVDWSGGGLTLVCLTNVTIGAGGTAYVSVYTPIEFTTAAGLVIESIVAIDGTPILGTFAPQTQTGDGQAKLTWSGLVEGIAPGVRSVGLFVQVTAGTVATGIVSQSAATSANITILPL